MINEEHWENIYQTKSAQEVSWTEAYPKASIDLLEQCNLTKETSVIDVGCGDSTFIPYLVSQGYTAVSAQDISKTALDRLKKKLGDTKDLIAFLRGDILELDTSLRFNFWHDRAVFHFLTEVKEVEAYLSVVDKVVKQYMCIATFATDGPLKCSGLSIRQYDKQAITALFEKHFELIQVVLHAHQTPFNTLQSFNYFLFKRKD